MLVLSPFDAAHRRRTRSGHELMLAYFPSKRASRTAPLAFGRQLQRDPHAPRPGYCRRASSTTPFHGRGAPQASRPSSVGAHGSTLRLRRDARHSDARVPGCLLRHGRCHDLDLTSIRGKDRCIRDKHTLSQECARRVLCSVPRVQPPRPADGSTGARHHLGSRHGRGARFSRRTHTRQDAHTAPVVPHSTRAPRECSTR